LNPQFHLQGCSLSVVTNQTVAATDSVLVYCKTTVRYLNEKKNTKNIKNETFARAAQFALPMTIAKPLGVHKKSVKKDDSDEIWV